MSDSTPAPTGPRPGSPHAAAAIWQWREAAALGGIAVLRQQRSALRREGAIRAVVGGAVGGVLFFFGAAVLARIAWAGAGIVLVAALVSPDRLYAGIGRALALLGHGVGRLLAVVFLTPVYGLFFVPFGRLLRSGRRDRLERWFDPAVASYWHRRDDALRTKSSYEKPY